MKDNLINISSLLFQKFNCSEFFIAPAFACKEMLDGSKMSTMIWNENLLPSGDLTELPWWKVAQYNLTISPEIRGIYIIEGNSLVFSEIRDEIANRFNSSDPIYFFNVDVYTSFLQYEVYQNGKKIRRYEFRLDEQGIPCEIDEGIRQEFEDKLLYAQDRYTNTDLFWLPIRVMEKYEIYETDLLQALDQTAQVMQLPVTLRNRIDELVKEFQ